MNKWIRRIGLISLLSYVLGVASNLLVMFVNQGFMPVVASACPPDIILDDSHVCAGPLYNHLLLLSDWIPYRGYLNSIGDTLLTIGVGLAVCFICLLLVKFVRWLYVNHRKYHS